MAEAALGEIKRRRRVVVLVPCPLQGHLTPMLQLGSILQSKGFSITVAHTEYNFPNPESYPGFTFVPLPDKVAGSDVNVNNVLNVISVINTNCKDSFQEYMVRFLGEEAEVNGTEVACVIYDGLVGFVDPVSVELKIPTIVLRTTNAASMYSYMVIFQLQADKLLPLPESRLEEVVPNLHPLRFKDLPQPANLVMPKESDDVMHNYMDLKSSSAIIWNTVEILEHSNLNQLQQQHWKVPFSPIGPFHKLAPLLVKEDTSCLSWLDTQAPNSVIYVSLGSLATIDNAALAEMAWGLAKSEQPFLWVVRDSLLNGSEAIECLPDDFSELVKERGCIVKWVQQNKVLAHPSVGGFLTHCGWNSTLESMCEGVPMICRPCFSDQMVNARYIAHVWKVGLELEQGTEGSIEKAVRNLMVDEQGKEIKRNALDMKQKLEDTISEGGSAYESLEDLVKFIISLSGKK